MVMTTGPLARQAAPRHPRPHHRLLLPQVSRDLMMMMNLQV